VRLDARGALAARPGCERLPLGLRLHLASFLPALYVAENREREPQPSLW